MSGQLWLPFNGMVEHGAEEGGELGVACHVATLWLRLGYSVIILITYE